MADATNSHDNQETRDAVFAFFSENRKDLPGELC